MPLIARWRRSDSVLEFEEAVRSRSRDAASLRSGKRGYWAIYTRGYMAEMLLKSAYFRFIGEGSTKSLSLKLKKKELQKRASQVGAMSIAQNLHDLIFWADLLICERAF